MLTYITFWKKFNRHDSYEYWPTSIKDTIHWFHFLTIMEHTENIMKTNNGLINSLLKVFAIFELRLLSDKVKLNVISIRYINCKRETVLFLKNTTFEEMVTKFVLN